jgi:hypothetical protein
MLNAWGVFPDMASGDGVVFLAEQSNVVAQTEQPLVQARCLLDEPDAADGIGQPEAARQE